ncbi:uncharacterized protein VP01_4826g2 [Puccinia sorghi]|uniref:Uncharacterized protein n=1 Tax=Puccinia sorghi TaxID=27349 RepID=A0A0L6UMI0_9BASI|nr:uncharacterized protein VP01_4826g2 [Puccinia sorghi]
MLSLPSLPYSLQPYYNYFTSDMFLVDQNKCLPQTFTWEHCHSPRRGQAGSTFNLEGSHHTGYNGKSFDHECGQFLYKRFLIKQQGPNSFTLLSYDAVAQALKSTHQALHSSLTQYHLENTGGRSNGLNYKYSAGLASSVKLVKIKRPVF